MRAREVYVVRVKGHIDGAWSDWLGGLDIHHRGMDETIITGPTLDQSGLQAILGKILDYNVKLVSVNLTSSGSPIGPSAEDTFGHQGPASDS